MAAVVHLAAAVTAVLLTEVSITSLLLLGPFMPMMFWEFLLLLLLLGVGLAVTRRLRALLGFFIAEMTIAVLGWVWLFVLVAGGAVFR